MSKDAQTVPDLSELRERHSHRGTVVEVAYWTIRDAVRRGRIRSGARLMETDLATALRMSRTPVREALRRLEVERLIENIPRRGLIVPEMTMEHLVEIFELRGALEGLAARLAATRMSPIELEVMRRAVEHAEKALEEDDLEGLTGEPQFHPLLRKGSKNTRLPEMLELLYDAYRPVRLHEFGPERSREAVAEHRAIYEAIARQDAEKAEALTREHNDNALRAYIRAYQDSES
jgi:DNA-binding GntR family transcriptional regulator